MYEIYHLITILYSKFKNEFINLIFEFIYSKLYSFKLCFGFNQVMQ